MKREKSAWHDVLLKVGILVDFKPWKSFLFFLTNFPDVFILNGFFHHHHPRHQFPFCKSFVPYFLAAGFKSKTITIELLIWFCLIWNICVSHTREKCEKSNENHRKSSWVWNIFKLIEAVSEQRRQMYNRHVVRDMGTFMHCYK